MFSLFKKDPLQQLEKSYEAKLKQAMTAQRNGDIKLYSALSAEADDIRLKLELLELQRGRS